MTLAAPPGRTRARPGTILACAMGPSFGIWYGNALTYLYHIFETKTGRSQAVLVSHEHHAIKFPSEEFALPLGLARPAALLQRKLSESRRLGSASGREAADVCRRSRRTAVPRRQSGRGTGPLGLREGVLSETRTAWSYSNFTFKLLPF